MPRRDPVRDSEIAAYVKIGLLIAVVIVAIALVIWQRAQYGVEQ